MAREASPSELISTKPKPRERPVSRSLMIATDSGVPVCAKYSRSSSSVAWNDRLPT